MKKKEKVSKMAENKLPNGVGKKIVQALKKQAEIEIQPISDSIDNNGSLIQDSQTLTPEFYSSEITDNVSLEDNFNDFSMDSNVEDEITNFEDDTSIGSEDKFEDNFPSSLNFDGPNTKMFDKDEIFNTPQQPQLKGVPQQKSYSMPANVAVLKRLIMQLPQGVTKQTGAQIIRQTMEALGISMNSVLKEAQQGQDSLTASAKACMSTIQEYRNNIKALEKQVQDYKKQAVALNDLISLFIMTDRH